jgi:hypothetical protein
MGRSENWPSNAIKSGIQLRPMQVKILWLSGIDDFHMLHFFSAVVVAVHLESLIVGVGYLPNGAMAHETAAGFGVLAGQGDGLTIAAGRAFHHKDAGTGGTHPGGDVMLGQIVVSVNRDAGKGLPHHGAVVFLL